MLAEYSANASASNPQKEYGYRNGELLITAAGSSCGVGNTGPQTWVGTDGHLGHLTGHAEGTNWAVYAGSDSPTAMVYGPYDATYGQGHHTAQFKLMVDNNSGSDVVGSLDVVTGYGGNVLATRQVRRSDFTAANQWQTFTLQFDNPCFGLFEARVWWAGNTSMKFAQLTITPLSVASSGVQWLVTDQLGTPRMVFDKTGSLSGVSRHDYLPFGEELYAGVGGRTAQEGYNTDSTRQHFTGYEADGETGLNFAQARYQSPVQGRFTSVDPLMASASVTDPQSLNRYSYVLNSPANMTDPSGLIPYSGADVGWSDVKNGFWGTDLSVGFRATERDRIMQNLQSDVRYTVRWRWIQYTDGEGEEHSYGWWDKAWANHGRDEDDNDNDFLERYLKRPRQTALEVADWASKGVKDFAYAVAPDYVFVNGGVPLVVSGSLSFSKDGHLYFSLVGPTAGAKNFKLGGQAGVAYFATTKMRPEDRDASIQGPGVNISTPYTPFGAYIPSSGTPAITIGGPFSAGVNGSKTYKIF